MKNTLTIDELFEGHIFHVPDYQRGYAWEKQQRAELLADLDLLAEDREHYTGTIVIHEENSTYRPLSMEGKKFRVVDVVDGQQRLTTIVLLLDGVRRELDSLGTELTKSLATGIERSFVSVRDTAGQSLYKLILNTDCDHYFRRVALSDTPAPEGPQITSERRLNQARTQFDEYLSQKQSSLQAQYEDWLVSLYQKIAHRLRVTVYEVNSAAEVGVIFEVMNNRGKPLSELEKVKNYLLYASSKISLPNQLSASVNGAWAEVLRQLMASGLTTSATEDRLLRSHWLTIYDPQPRKWDGSNTVRAKFDFRAYEGQPELLSHLANYTDSLRSCCFGYCDASSPERSDSFASISDASIRDEIRRWSAKLLRIDVVVSFLPLLIATRMRFAADGTKYLELVKLCEAFAFRVYRILERRADAGQGNLFRIGFQLQRGEIDFDTAMQKLRATLEAFASDQSIETALRSQQTSWYAWTGIKYFLYEYEEHLADQKGSTPKVPWDSIRRRERADTIEHILPQTPSNSYWLERFDDAARSKLTHDLGNLCLTKDNSSYGNKSFPEKKGASGSGKPCYAESSLLSEKEIANYEEWAIEELTSRREHLVEWALTRWKVDFRLSSPATDLSIDEAESDSEAGIVDEGSDL